MPVNILHHKTVKRTISANNIMKRLPHYSAYFMNTKEEYVELNRQYRHQYIRRQKLIAWIRRNGKGTNNSANKISNSMDCPRPTFPTYAYAAICFPKTLTNF